ncbi:CDP-diacylglycerol--glycerol-3-phosphate 3-phosphatidyltransferase [hydrothermal vent metagenome]|uniref:CDP-diacylglycerol--glycerol-3-phosphate 3-phosphatidyltransferase n=1 Tax=hydrothermal vent metagenome TaxID=652676 RepID=A0A3B0ZEH2_9ZZZZ
MKKRDIPNCISIFRIIFVIPVIYLLLVEQYTIALFMFLIAGLSDALDGFLAKRYNWESPLGSVLDPIADKLLLVSTYFALCWLGHIPVWLVIAVIARDVIIVIGAFSFYFLVGRYDMVPSWLSKINTCTQILLGLVVVSSLSFTSISVNVVDFLILVVLLTTILSGADYVLTWGKRAWRAKRKHAS